MKKALIIFLIITFGGLVLFLIGMPQMDTNFAMSGWGLVIYCAGSFMCAIISGTKLTQFLFWQASDLSLGCLLFPLYMLVYPIIGAILCLGGWIFGIKKLIEIKNQ